MATEKKRITKDEWWDICFALECHIREQIVWLARNEMASTRLSVERNKELLTRLVNTKLSERDKYASFPDWVEW
jgi:hypothetical protein